MAPRLKPLSGAEVVTILGNFGFVVFSQRGSHIKLRRSTLGGTETLVVPLRSPVPVGTLKAIYNQAAKYVSTDELRKHFY